ncbi:MAG TPA: PPK2 family polyphosphate kinase [Micromonosporaceae bacterium]
MSQPPENTTSGPSIRSLLRVGPAPDLTAIDPRGTPGLPGLPDAKQVHRDPKVWARAELASLGAELARQQEMLYATVKRAEPGSLAAIRRVLLILQAMDCGGKDGTIRVVAGALNPQGLAVHAFGPPTAEELEHNFLWRIRRALPPAGYVGVFNRSHYEDVLIVRVHSLVPRRTWRARYDAINRFERRLVDDGYALLKVMLHISYGEQRQRLLARLADPTKHWKYNPGDVDERARWDDYQAAYADALARCGTDEAPWHVVPADRKWYRNWAVANLLLETMRDMALTYPKADFDAETERRRLEAESGSAQQIPSGKPRRQDEQRMNER